MYFLSTKNQWLVAGSPSARPTGNLLSKHKYVHFGIKKDYSGTISKHIVVYCGAYNLSIFL